MSVPEVKREEQINEIDLAEQKETSPVVMKFLNQKTAY